MLVVLYLLAPTQKCETAPIIAPLESCRRLDATSKSAPLTDNDLCTSWSSHAFAPRAVKLATKEKANALIVVPQMAPAFGSVYLRINGHKTDAEMHSGAPYLLFLDAADAIEVETTASVSHVAWRELIPLHCDSPPK